MGRERTTDLALVIGVGLSAAVFAASVFAVSGFASLVAAPPLRVEATQSAIQHVEGASGLAIQAETFAGVLVPGWSVNYLVIYDNLGGATAPITVTARLPEGTFLVQAWWGLGDQPDAGQELPSPTEPTPGTLVWKLPDLPGGETRWFHIELFLDPALLGPGAELSLCGDISPAPDETSAEDNQFCTYDLLNSSGPNLAVKKSHEWTTPDFSELRYEIRVWNWGTAGYEAVWLTDTLPVGTTWTGEYGSNLGADPQTTGPDWVRFVIPLLDHGDTGRIWITATVDAPEVPGQFFTNTVEIRTPPGEVRPDDNFCEDLVVSPREVHAVDVHVATDRSRMFVAAPLVPTGFITVTTIISPTTPINTVVQPIGPDCRCVEFADIGPVYPGDLILIEAGAASQPVTITVPTPFEAAANSEFNSVSGWIDSLDGDEDVEVALYDGPVRVVHPLIGWFFADFPDVPRGAVGEVRYRTEVDSTELTFRRRFYTNDLVLNVHLRDDWIDGYFEAGYPLEIAVTESDTVTSKGTAELETGFPPWWEGFSGFTTLDGDPWSPARPDIQPGDWVMGWIDVLEAAGDLQVGEITGTVDLDADTVSGGIWADWLTEPIPGACAVLQEGGPTVEFLLDPGGGEYVCDFGGIWDLHPADQVLVYYRQPDGHRVMNQFPLPPPALGVGKQGLGNPGSGGNFEYLVTLFNDGGGPAVGTHVTDTLPVGMTFLGQTSTFTTTVVGPQIVFDVGVFEPGVELQFSLFTHVTALPSITVTNTVDIAASNVITGTGTAAWPNVVYENDADLSVAASPSAALPDPDSDLVWTVEVCNLGTTSSATAMFTTTLPAATPLTGWIPDAAGWSEVAMTSELLAATRPTVPDSACFLHHLTTHIPPDANPGQHLCLTAEVLADGDSDPFNDAVVECVYVSGSAPAIAIEKKTNGVDADGPPGPLIVVGQAVEWVYEVTNTGNVTLTAVAVEDDQPGVVPACPIDVLGPDDVMTCTAAGVAVEGQYANIGTARGTPPIPIEVSDSDPSHYLGVPPDMIFEDGFESGTTGAWSGDFP
jgi:uncharacterized repeat protein (TIGR01451 family)